MCFVMNRHVMQKQYIFKGDKSIKIVLILSEKRVLSKRGKILPKGSTLKGKNLLPLGANSFLVE